MSGYNKNDGDLIVMEGNCPDIQVSTWLGRGKEPSFVAAGCTANDINYTCIPLSSTYEIPLTRDRNTRDCDGKKSDEYI